MMAEPQNLGTSEPAYSYRKLILWQQAQDLAHEIVVLLEGLPANRTSDTLFRQVVRAATSIPANIAEGHGRFSPAAYRNHLSIAKGSACELDSWLDLLRRRTIVTADQEADLHSKCFRLIAALTGRMRDLEKIATKAVREDAAPYLTSDQSETGEGLDGSMVPGFRGSAS
jgi:four helix bundle protein